MTPQNSGKTAVTPEGRRFQPGQSGNPGGRPKGLARRVRDLVGNDGEELARFMLDVLRNEARPVKERMEAATWLADRGWGRPTQMVATDEESAPQTFVVRSAFKETVSAEKLLEGLKEIGLVAPRLESRTSVNESPPSI